MFISKILLLQFYNIDINQFYLDKKFDFYLKNILKIFVCSKKLTTFVMQTKTGRFFIVKV